MPTRKSKDYKLSAVQYYLIEDNSQENVCKIFKCSRRSLMRWVKQYEKDGNVNIKQRKPIAYKVHKEHVDFYYKKSRKIKQLQWKIYYTY
jgi:transposase-like protein